MMILKILFIPIFFYYVVSTFSRFIFPYVAISNDIKFRGEKKNVDTFIVFEVVTIIPLIFLAWIIDEEQFIFNLRDATLWLVGIFFFLCIHLRGVIYLYSTFFRKEDEV